MQEGHKVMLSCVLDVENQETMSKGVPLEG